MSYDTIEPSPCVLPCVLIEPSPCVLPLCPACVLRKGEAGPYARGRCVNEDARFREREGTEDLPYEGVRGFGNGPAPTHGGAGTQGRCETTYLPEATSPW